MPDTAASSSAAIYIIRHGQTALNRQGVLQGRSDHPLNPAGEDQARKAAALFRRLHVTFDHAFTSPLRRAVQTAGIIAPYLAAEEDSRLLEMDYGPYEGADLAHPSPELAAFFRDFAHTPAPHGMESLESVVRRSGAFMEDIRHLSGNILISTHAISMKGILEYLTPDAHGAFWSRYIGNCAVYVCRLENSRFSVPEPVPEEP